MTDLLIVAHAPVASALLVVAEHAYAGCSARVRALDVQADEPPEQVAARLRALLGPQDTLILADAFGATPCNVASQVADGTHVRVVSGVNVPMLWRVLCYAQEPLDALVARAVAGGAQGCMPLAAVRPQSPVGTARGAPHDQGHVHDQ